MFLELRFRRLAVGKEPLVSAMYLHTVSREEFRKGLVIPEYYCVINS